MKLLTTVIDTAHPEEIATFNGYYIRCGRRWAVLKIGKRVLRNVPADRLRRVYAKAHPREDPLRIDELLKLRGISKEHAQMKAAQYGVTIRQFCEAIGG